MNNTYDWVLTGTKPVKEGTVLTEDQIKEMLEVAFKEGSKFQLFLCGAMIDRTGTLEEMEDGLKLIIAESEDYKPGDYCIISSHEYGSLLFMPIKPEETQSLLTPPTAEA